MKTFIQSIIKVQNELKAPKNQFNSFGKYKYRNCEDILEALKPLLVKEGLLLTINDEIICVDSKDAMVVTTFKESKYNSYSKKDEETTKTQVDGGSRYYIKSIVTITDGEHSQSVTALAREEQEKKGMDGAQVTGATSSYARKYALNAMFLIDDTKDADSHEPVKETKAVVKAPAPTVKVPYADKISACSSLEDFSILSSMIKDDWATIPAQHHTAITEAMKAKKLQLTPNA